MDGGVLLTQIPTESEALRLHYIFSAPSAIKLQIIIDTLSNAQYHISECLQIYDEISCYLILSNKKNVLDLLQLLC